MNFVANKFNRFVLLLAFVFTTLGSVPGFAWCIGEDGHFEVEYVAARDCGSATSTSGTIPGESYFHFDEGHCGPCLDFYFLSPEALSAKRLNHKANKSPTVIALSKTPSFNSLAARLVDNNLDLQSPPRIFQAILEHRTIVLLI